MDNSYLLNNNIARELYFDTAKSLPVIDFHNHLNVQELAADRVYSDVSEIWLKPDPYKHRAMRILGVDERYITGDASNKEKFFTWCRVFPRLAGNALYDWSRLEKEMIFGIDAPICENNAELLWDEINACLKKPEYSAKGFFRRFDVEYASPCALLTDELDNFKDFKELAPSLRGDDWVCPSLETLNKLSSQTGIEIKDPDSLYEALRLRLDAMAEAGCRFADHALDNGFIYTEEDGSFHALLSRILAGESLELTERAKVFCHLLRFFGGEYARRGWVMQLHIGAQRVTSQRLLKAVGPAGGHACIGNDLDVRQLIGLLNDMEQGENGLPKVILFTLNPVDNAKLACLSGSFVGVTQGPAWWWCDHLHGMRQMLDNFSVYSVLSTFVGMTTDSRSLLSLLRHDYFRRCLCGWIGDKAEQGELPGDMEELKSIVKAVCYDNAKAMIS